MLQLEEDWAGVAMTCGEWDFVSMTRWGSAQLSQRLEKTKTWCHETETAALTARKGGWIKGNCLGNHWIAPGLNGWKGYLGRAHSGHLIVGERSPPSQKRDKVHCTLLLTIQASELFIAAMSSKHCVASVARGLLPGDFCFAKVCVENWWCLGKCKWEQRNATNKVKTFTKNCFCCERPISMRNPCRKTWI